MDQTSGVPATILHSVNVISEFFSNCNSRVIRPTRVPSPLMPPAPIPFRETHGSETISSYRMGTCGSKAQAFPLVQSSACSNQRHCRSTPPIAHHFFCKLNFYSVPNYFYILFCNFKLERFQLVKEPLVRVLALVLVTSSSTCTSSNFPARNF